MKDAYDTRTGELMILSPELSADGYQVVKHVQSDGVTACYDLSWRGELVGSYQSTRLMAAGRERHQLLRQVERKSPGGRRPGSGRKPLDKLGTVVTSIRMTGEQRATFEMLGGVQWLRDHLQAVIDSEI